MRREATTTDCVCKDGRAKLARREATTTYCVCKDGRAKLVRREATTTYCVCKQGRARPVRRVGNKDVQHIYATTANTQTQTKQEKAPPSPLSQLDPNSSGPLPARPQTKRCARSCAALASKKNEEEKNISNFNSLTLPPKELEAQEMRPLLRRPRFEEKKKRKQNLTSFL